MMGLMDLNIQLHRTYSENRVFCTGCGWCLHNINWFSFISGFSFFQIKNAVKLMRNVISSRSADLTFLCVIVVGLQLIHFTILFFTANRRPEGQKDLWRDKRLTQCTVTHIISKWKPNWLVAVLLWPEREKETICLLIVREFCVQISFFIRFLREWPCVGRIPHLFVEQAKIAYKNNDQFVCTLVCAL